MNCRQSARQFSAYWDDEMTQAEREWLEAHFSACDDCRREYEQFARSLELLGSLPRAEAAPELAERVLARARRTTAAPDRLPVAGVPWVPVTAAAALLLLVGTLLLPMMGRTPRLTPGGVASGPLAVHEPVLVQPVAGSPPGAEPHAVSTPETRALAAASVATDSLFDHSRDVEFILDPVLLRRGQASVATARTPVAGERAVVSF